MYEKRFVWEFSAGLAVECPMAVGASEEESAGERRVYGQTFEMSEGKLSMIVGVALADLIEACYKTNGLDCFAAVKLTLEVGERSPELCDP